MKKEKRHGELSPPAQVTCQGLIEGCGSRDQLVVDGRIVALFAHLVDEFLNNLPIGVANGARVGNDLEVRFFEILEKNIPVEAKQSQPLEDLLGVVQEIRDQNH